MEQLFVSPRIPKEIKAKILSFIPLSNIISLRCYLDELSPEVDLSLKIFTNVDRLCFKNNVFKRKIMKTIDKECLNIDSICYSKKNIDDVIYDEKDMKFISKLISRSKKLKGLINIPSSLLRNRNVNFNHLEELRVKLSDNNDLFIIAEKCPNIKILEICASLLNLNNSISRILKNCKKISVLNIHRINLSANNIKSLYPEIEEFCVYNTNLNDTHCEEISKFKKIKNLVVSGKEITNKGIMNIGQNLKDLKFLDIAETNLNPSICSFLTIEEILPKLEKLVVHPKKEKEFMDAINFCSKECNKTL